MWPLLSLAVFLAHHVLASSSSSIGLFSDTPIRLIEPTVNTPSHTVAGHSHFNITARVDGYDQQVAFVLEPNQDLITQGTRVRYLDDSRDTQNVESLADLPYHVTKGAVWTNSRDQHWNNVGWARLMVTRDGPAPLFEGTFTILSQQFQVRTQTSGSSESDSNEQLWVYPTSSINSTNIPQEGLSLERAGCITTPRPTLDKRQTWFSNDSTTNNTGKPLGCSATRHIAYIGVAIDCSYRAAFDSDEEVKRNIISVANTASVVFENSFNIALALRDFYVSGTECSNNTSSTHQWNAPCSSGDLNWRLNQFTAWRATVQDDNAYWTLMTGCAAPDGEIGVSWVGEVCKTGKDYNGLGSGIGANVVGHSSTEWQVFAHESAHMFGANHDCDSDACASNLDSPGDCCPFTSSTCDAQADYLMSPITNKGMTGFSDCTIGSICSQISRADVDTRCLVTQAEVDDLQEEVNLPVGQCGNGIVENGEGCDCGGDSCDESERRCCDPVTCQWRDEGVCALSQDEGGGFSSWLGDHKSLFIGLCAGLGSCIILLVGLLVFASVHRKRRKKKLKEGDSDNDS
ncbi:Metallo-peptidase family M12-domain-containing protein [Aspergillus karnatakaensis]|uniref:Metallo-peptidase family M12-domain-containing protein n=1 Tax=Aspergillus karnatakaensis TaxID=1810916 RepID=UPI003CCCB0EF